MLSYCKVNVIHVYYNSNLKRYIVTVHISALVLQSVTPERPVTEE